MPKNTRLVPQCCTTVLNPSDLQVKAFEGPCASWKSQDLTTVVNNFRIFYFQWKHLNSDAASHPEEEKPLENQVFGKRAVDLPILEGVLREEDIFSVLGAILKLRTIGRPKDHHDCLACEFLQTLSIESLIPRRYLV